MICFKIRSKIGGVVAWQIQNWSSRGNEARTSFKMPFKMPFRVPLLECLTPFVDSWALLSVVGGQFYFFKSADSIFLLK
jgi:hypothetical protein